MPKLNNRLPKYRHHKASGQGIVTLNGDDRYLGVYGSEESHARYDKLIAEWLNGGRRPQVLAAPTAPAPMLVKDVILRFWEHAQTYYRHSNGSPTGEVDNYRRALRLLRRLNGETAAVDFGPQALETLRQHMILLGWSRKSINRQMHRVCSIFRWAASKELVPAGIYERLKTLGPLKRGRTNARETPRVKPVPEHLMAPLKPFLSDQVWAIIQLQILVGHRRCRVPWEECRCRCG